MDNMSAPPESTGVEKKWSEKAETVWQELIRWKHKPRKRENVTGIESLKVCENNTTVY